MSKLTWDQNNYSAGIDRCVIYLPTGAVAWSGVTSVTENPDALTGDSVYLDGVKYLTPQFVGDFLLGVDAFTYPDEFSDYTRSFGFSYRENNQIHLVYNCRAEPSDVAWKTETNSIAPAGFSWKFVTVPVEYPGIKPTAHFILDLSLIPDNVVSAFEDVLYGTDTDAAQLPSFGYFLELLLTMTVLRVFNHGDGTWTAIGPDEAVVWLDDTTWQLTWPTAVYIDADSYTLSSD